MPKLIILMLMTLLTPPVGVYAGGPSDGIMEIGRHYPVMVFEKSKNPENIMIIYTKLNRDCSLRTDPEQSPSGPVLGFYWLMNRTTYKPVHPLIKEGIQQRIKVELNENPDEKERSFWISIQDLQEMRTDIEEIRMLVKARIDTETRECVAEGFLTLGPSNGNAVIRLDTIYSQVKGLIKPAPEYVRLIGVNTANGKPVRRTYYVK